MTTQRRETSEGRYVSGSAVGTSANRISPELEKESGATRGEGDTSQVKREQPTSHRPAPVPLLLSAESPSAELSDLREVARERLALTDEEVRNPRFMRALILVIRDAALAAIQAGDSRRPLRSLDGGKS